MSLNENYVFETQLARARGFLVISRLFAWRINQDNDIPEGILPLGNSFFKGQLKRNNG